MWCVVVDVDHDDADWAADRADLPEPSWTAVNPFNGHAHLAYVLQIPVARSDASRTAPLRYLAQHMLRVSRDLKTPLILLEDPEPETATGASIRNVPGSAHDTASAEATSDAEGIATANASESFRRAMRRIAEQARGEHTRGDHS